MHISVTIAQFELQTNWFLNELTNVSDQQSNEQAADNLNPIKWVAGHILTTRMTLLGLLTGAASDQNFNKLFGKGSSGKIDPSVPALDGIKIRWGAVSSELTECLKNIPGEKLLSPPPFQISIPDKTLHGLIAYMASHESYHIGQLSVLKRLI